MQKQMLGGKIHRVTVTEACIDYPGSITIDKKLMDAADILPHEKVLIANLNNGSRIESYAIPGPAGSEWRRGQARESGRYNYHSDLRGTYGGRSQKAQTQSRLR